MPFRHKTVGASLAIYAYAIDKKYFCLNDGNLTSLLLLNGRSAANETCENSANSLHKLPSRHCDWVVFCAAAS
jgi:hypothetical protein